MVFTNNYLFTYISINILSCPNQNAILNDQLDFNGETDIKD